MPKKVSFLLAGAGIITLGVAAFSMQYSSLLGARYAPGLEFKILGPDNLIAGEPAIVTWDTSPEIRAVFPTEKIEFCTGQNFGEGCTVLNSETPNDGEAQVFVPSSLKQTSGYLRLTARTKNGVLGNRSTIRPINVKYGTVLEKNKVSIISWTNDPQYTNVIVEFCIPNQASEKCYSLAKKSTNSGLLRVLVPNEIPAKKGYVRVYAAQANGTAILADTQYGRLPVDLGAVLLKATQQSAGGNIPDSTESEEEF